MNKVQEALNSAIEVLQRSSDAGYSVESDDALNLCKSALSEIENSAPVVEPIMAIRLAINEILESGEKLPKKTRELIYFMKNVSGEILAQDPVAEVTKHGIFGVDRDTIFEVGTKFYTSPISKEWVGLSDDHIKYAALKTFNRQATANDFEFAWQIDAKLKQLNMPEKG